jgi:tetratricopeptide (TPR) repeat protein
MAHRYSSCFIILCLLFTSTFLLGCESELRRQVADLERTRNTDGAVALLERTVNRDPGHAEAQFLLGKYRFEAGDFTEGQEAFAASLEQTRRFEEQIAFTREKYFRERYDTGVRAIESERPARAIGALEDARTIKPEEFDVHRTLGHAHMQAEAFGEAEQAYNAALQRAPEDLETLANLGEVQYRRGAYASALTHTETGLGALDDEAHPLRADFLRRKANSHLQLEQEEQAEAAFRALVELEGGAVNRRDYARTLFNQRKYDAALTQLRRIGADDEEYLRMVAEARYHTNDYDGMIETYERLLATQPNDEEALRNLIIGYEMVGDEQQAASFRERLQAQTRGGSDE